MFFSRRGLGERGEGAGQATRLILLPNSLSMRGQYEGSSLLLTFAPVVLFVFPVLETISAEHWTL